ncbi:MAG: zf-HC2 domain-containing protein [Planctomycetota bacterium]|jgi:predicted anti-sigma-YlaC factor YlaD
MMSSDCERIRDQIADFITGLLPEAEIRGLEHHLSECSACREYGEALEEEDELLAGLFAKLDTRMKGWEDEVIDTINQLDPGGQSSLVSAGAAVMRSFLARYATAAVVVLVVALYFIITLSWISQINECIEPFENLLTQQACT